MADTKLADYPARLGDKQLVMVDHTGPASYTVGGETLGQINNQTGITAMGLSSLDGIWGSGSYSVSGNYWVQAVVTGKGSRKTWKLIWNLQDVSTAVIAITPGASPFAYTALAEGSVTVAGGTVSAISITRGATVVPTGATAGIFPLSQGDIITVTYSVVPTTMNFIPSGTDSEVNSGSNLSAESVRIGYLGR